jgi:hypothetical protein
MPSPVPELIAASDLKNRGTLRKVNRLIRWAQDADTAIAANGFGDSPGRDTPPRFHPFRVYRLPATRRPIDTTPEGTDPATWFATKAMENSRKFIVRAGRIGQTEVTGTDAMPDPYSGQYPTDLSAEIEIADDVEAYAIWIEYQPGTTPAAAINHSADPGGVGEDWPGYPGPCTTEGTICRLIALVNSTVKPATIRQFIVADEPDWVQACISVAGVEKVINVACDGQPFDFVDPPA